jgi:hypothetical protein
MIMFETLPYKNLIKVSETREESKRVVIFTGGELTKIGKMVLSANKNCYNYYLRVK